MVTSYVGTHILLRASETKVRGLHATQSVYLLEISPVKIA
jgi:hypothetical protein